VAAIPAEARPTVYWEVYDDPLTTAGPATFIGQLIDLAGATSSFADASEEYPQVSAEAVFARDPQVILGPDSQGMKLSPDTIAQRPGWADVRAVRDGRIYLLDGDIVSRPGPRLADALEALVAVLYPESFQ
jgi:iron complex transport system substrate-binding protein